jgi:general secretion pathway protein A
MYETYYELSSTPFNITPDPRYLYFSHQHREAFEHILFGIQQRKGFVQVTGEVGAGKSTICRAVLAVLEQSPEEYATALILNPVLTGTQLLRSILRELDLDDRGNADDCVVLILDEAQDLSDELLEEVRLLSNLETEDRKLLQIVLVGQPELRRKLDAPRLRQLRQRITVRYHLGPIGRAETEDYILHRLTVAGSRGRPTFSRAALWAIFRYSRGVPRLINTVCDKALLAGYVEGRDHLGWKQVRRGIRELEGGGR